MPLYMDRHDMPGATAEEVARNHARDLALADEYDVQLLAYWYDEEAGGAFCFARAPEADAFDALHRASHGAVANEIITVSEGDVVRFLGRIHDPVDETEVTSAFRTILFTDLAGSTALLETLGEPAFMVLLTEHDLIIRKALVATRGREVKHTGDGIMAAFDDVDRALDCAIAIQAGFDARGAAGESPELAIRVGLAAGEPVDRDDDMFGTAVNLASRICDAADAGQILVSDVVRDLGVARGYSLGDADARSLKGFSAPVPVFELRRPTG